MKIDRSRVMRPAKILIAIVVCGAALSISAHGQTPTTNPPQAQPAPYRPGMGDFMTAGVQPRHIKLAAAGQLGNWAYAASALREMNESFDRIVRTIPMYRSMPTTDLIGAFVKQPMAQVDEAI
jgi:hypothetical protein